MVYCQDRFVAVEYDSLGDSPQGQLEQLVDDVLVRTGFDQVVLAGHSQGTGHACAYLESHSDKVAHYLNLSGRCDGLGVPSLSLSSENDLGVRDDDGERIPGPVPPPAVPTQERVTLEREDHVAVAGSKNAFLAMWRYLHDEDPQYTTIQCGQDPVVLDMFDANLNKQSDLGRVYNVSFLWGTDVYVDSSTPRWLDVRWRNEEGHTATLKVPNWDSGIESDNPFDRNLAALYLPH